MHAHQDEKTYKSAHSAALLSIASLIPASCGYSLIVLLFRDAAEENQSSAVFCNQAETTFRPWVGKHSAPGAEYAVRLEASKPTVSSFIGSSLRSGGFRAGIGKGF